MPTSVKVSGTWKTAAPSVKVSGTWKAASHVYTRVSGVWKSVFEAEFPVNLSESSVGGSCNDPTFCTATSNEVTATPAGGEAPYTYLWELVSGEALIVPTASTSATTGFSKGGFTPNELSAVYRCAVTDNAGTTSYSGNVTVTLTYTT